METLGLAFFVVAVISFLSFIQTLFYWSQVPAEHPLRSDYEQSMGFYLAIFFSFAIFSWLSRTGLI